MNRKFAAVLVAIALGGLVGGRAWGHCQIPCGIYDDDARFTLMLEHVTTIEKSMKQVKELSKAKGADKNQLVRWVNNKEHHASELAEIITFYFMAQRVKPVSTEDAAAHQAYTRKVTVLHQMLVQTMKAKQSPDVARCADLRKLVGEFKALYLAK